MRLFLLIQVAAPRGQAAPKKNTRQQYKPVAIYASWKGHSPRLDKVAKTFNGSIASILNFRGRHGKKNLSAASSNPRIRPSGWMNWIRCLLWVLRLRADERICFPGSCSGLVWQGKEADG